MDPLRRLLPARQPFWSGLTASLAAWTIPTTLLQAQSPDPTPAATADANSGFGTRWEGQLGPEGIWQGGIGDGFRSTVQSFGLSLGANVGVPLLGGHQSHHLALVSWSYGNILGSVVGEGRWFRGNWEVRTELFTGAEFSPDTEWLVGLTPHLRYNLATGTRWVPFADLGAGVSATGIGPPDLSGTFEFNLQGGVGVNWFMRNNVALTVETHFLHLSCAGLNKPNLGLNGVTGTVGLTFFFGRDRRLGGS